MKLSNDSYQMKYTLKGIHVKTEVYLGIKCIMDTTYPWIPFTCTSGVHDELSHFKGVSFDQTFSKHLHFTGITNLRLAHHDLEWAVGHMFSILLHADHMLTDLFRSEGYSWRQRATGLRSLFQFNRLFHGSTIISNKSDRPQDLALHQKPELSW